MSVTLQIAVGAALAAVRIADTGYHDVCPLVPFAPFFMRPDREKPFG
jgi:hypothetical protein